MSINPDRPQFLHRPTGTRVNQTADGLGYDPNDLEPLPEGYWEAEEVEAAIRAVKAEAARQIEEISPWWRQQNDMRIPSPEGEARFAAIDAIRAQSNADEALLKEKHNG